MGDVLVLCYHAVSDDWNDALAVTPALLREQLKSVLRSGSKPERLTDALGAQSTGRRFVVTFDDAFASVYDNGYGVLRDLGIPGTVFAPTSFVSSGRPLAWEGLDDTTDLGELRPMSWEQLRELADDGWEVGSHTRTHPRLTQIDAAARADELQVSMAECEEMLRRPCRSIAYPHGDVDASVVEATRRAGYDVGVILGTSASGPRGLVYPRVGVYRHDSLGRFRLKTARMSRSRPAVEVLRFARRAGRALK